MSATAAEVGVAVGIEVGGFTASRERFDTVLAFLDGAETAAISHGELEDHLQAAGRELVRQLYQDHLDLRAQREQRVAVIGTDGAARARVETGHTRQLMTVFGQVKVTRIAYRAPARPNLHPADAVLNLPDEYHSHGLRRLAMVEATRGSYDDAVTGSPRQPGNGWANARSRHSPPGPRGRGGFQDGNGLFEQFDSVGRLGEEPADA